MNTQAINRVTQPMQKIKTDDGWAIVNSIGQQVSKVSERYTLVQNADVLNPLVQRFGAENLKSLYTFSSGRNLHASFATGRDFDLGEGDAIQERFMLINSYDKSKSFQFLLGAFRKVCANGLYSQFSGLQYRKIHVGEIPVQEIVQNALNAYSQNNFENWRRLKAVPLTVEQERELIEGFNAIEVKDPTDRWAPGNMSNTNIKRLARRFAGAPESLDNQRNGWGLYNQLNQALTREFWGKSKTTQKINTNFKAETYLMKNLGLN